MHGREMLREMSGAVKKGGRVACGGIQVSEIPSFPYRILWEERQVMSVGNLTRAGAHAFLSVVPNVVVKTEVVLSTGAREGGAGRTAWRTAAGGGGSHSVMGKRSPLVFNEDRSPCRVINSKSGSFCQKWQSL